VDKLHALTLSPGVVSFDLVSLFTMVPIKTAMEQIERDFPLDIAKLFRHYLTTDLLPMAGWILRTEWWCSIEQSS